MTVEPAQENLLQQVNTLSSRYLGLGNRLGEAAQQLQGTGTPLSEDLLEELVKYSRDFNQLQQQILTDFPGAATRLVSLKDLEQEVKAMLQSSASLTDHQQASSTLERVLSFRHRETEEFPALQSVQVKAAGLQSQLTTATSTTTSTALSGDLTALMAGSHPLHALVTLVDRQDDLDDAQWALLEEKIETAFGKTLAIAVSRGKIVSVAQNNFPAPVQQSQTPAIPVAPMVTASADIVILEEPTAAAPQDVIIVPSVELPQNPPTLDGKNIVFGNLPLQAKTTPVGLKVLVHLQGLGDRMFGAQDYAGTRGQGRRVEAFQINIAPPVPGLSLQYQAHLSGIGDTPMIPEGQLAGERDKGRQLEGLVIELTGPQATQYDVFYLAHIQNKGDVPVCTNGQYCGTRGQGLRIEGIKVWIQPKQ
ncbi:MAG: hydrogenase [Oscillatoriales cyanobacterium RM2_1_1]|nr:hydrogenase [Oscillatoriales cyanobacterium SM2_3_0]NJO44183.1 hydrogenase [Oscillatoriales cyanobacterium RM2_1_1]